MKAGSLETIVLGASECNLVNGPLQCITRLGSFQITNLYNEKTENFHLRIMLTRIILA